jgi:6-phosphogluconolactonase
MLPIREDGGLEPASDFHQHHGSSVNPGRQKEPHAHSINVDPQNRFAFAADLGIDKIVIYRMDLENGKLIPTGKDASVAPGAGPRHFTFDAAGRFAYVINELDNTVTAFSYDAEQGVLTEIQVISTLPDDFSGTSYCAEIVMASSGQFLYGSNRGHDSIAIFTVDAESGKLSTVGYESVRGKNPRNFILDPTGTYLFVANQDTGNVVGFKVDATTGELKATGHDVQVSKPVCVKFFTASG